MITFTVFGKPQPQGSSRAFVPKGWKRPIITSANPANKSWRQEVAGQALCEMQGKPVIPREQGVCVAIQFYFDKPKSTKKAQTCKVTKPDVDKLARSVLDALTGIVLCDDAQVTQLIASKHFGSPERACISVQSELRAGDLEGQNGSMS